MCVCEWVERLSEKLELMRDCAVEIGAAESAKRKCAYDQGKVNRSLVEGDKIWVRIPGKASKMEDAWDGPYVVLKKLGEVNYRVRLDGSRKTRTIHVNTAKRFVERVSVNGVTVLAEEEDREFSHVKLGGEVIESVKKEIDSVLEEYRELMDGSVGTYVGKPVSIVLDEGAMPVSKKPYRIPEAIREQVKEAVDVLVKNDWVEPIESAWGSPIVPVRKPDGSIRLCVNYKEVNDKTRQIQFPIPHFEDLVGEVGKAEVLSKIDLTKGYYQVPLKAESRDVTSFVTPWGCFRFKVLPFGLKNAPAIFQRIMEQILRECKGWSVVYIDDILVYSDKNEDHEKLVQCVLEVISRSGMKCDWAKEFVEFLGHVIGRGQISVPEARVQALKEYRKPWSRRYLRAFLGTIGYYRKF